MFCHPYLVQYFLHDFAEALRLVFVVDQEEECQVSPLPPGPLTQQRMVGLAHVGLQSYRGTGGLEPELLVPSAPGESERLD